MVDTNKLIIEYRNLAIKQGENSINGFYVNPAYTLPGWISIPK